jgi:hypothetical protein
MKTNKELNTAYDLKERERLRPKKPAYDFGPLEAVMRQWIKAHEQT